MEACADEPWFGGEVFHGGDGLVGGLAVGLVVVRAFEVGDLAPFEGAVGEIAARAGITEGGGAEHGGLIP